MRSVSSIPACGRGWRRLTAAALLAAAPAGIACNDFLKAENPGAIQADDLNNPLFLTLMSNGVVGEFQSAYNGGTTGVLYYSTLFGDEIRNHHVFFEERLFDLRQVAPDNGTHSAFVYTPLQRARFNADSVGARIRGLLGDTAGRDVRVARALAFGGYNYILLGENFCEAPINGSVPKTPTELFTIATQKFDSAITIALAAKTYQQTLPTSTASTALINGADSVMNLARVGGGRAALNLGDKPRAIAYVTGVPNTFEYRLFYSLNSSGENNAYYNRFSTGSSGSNSASVSNTPFQGLSDPRVPHPATTERMQDASNAFNPNAGSAFSTYSGTVAGADFTQATSIRIASGLEAQYVLAESNGPTTASIAFIESRRLVAPASPGATVVTNATNFLTNLIEQRRRDFFMDGHRVGDLRRYQKQYTLDFWPHGAYPGTTTGETYADVYCLPLTLAEINGNPNIPKP